NAANAAAAQASFKQAVAAFRKGLELYPQEQWLLVGLGSALDGLGRFEEARPIYQKAIAWNPTSGPIHLYYATHLRLAGKYDEAETMYKKSLQLYWNQGAVAGLELLAKALQVQASSHELPAKQGSPMRWARHTLSPHFSINAVERRRGAKHRMADRSHAKRGNLYQREFG